ncbi:MAG: cysteine desulfurase [Bacteroidetes bacterium]|jgi:cysteine desulfurase|nr:cysteine desulfurase [Bacteroidota bacterium]
MRVYLDNAATTPLLPEVLDAMMPYLTDVHGNPSSVHGHGREVRTAIEQARKTIAQAMGCSPAEIVFTSGGTEANNMAIKGAVRGLGVQRIITAPTEHHAVLHAAEHCAHYLGTEVVYLQPNAAGEADLATLAQLLAGGKKTLVSLMHGNNEIGVLNDLHAIGQLCRQHGALFHTDAVQTVGHLPLNTGQLPVDYLSASAHKFNGPKGVGFLYRNADAPALPPLIDGGSQERNQRAGTENVPAIIGMAKALELSQANMTRHMAHIQALKNHMIQGLRARIPGVAFNGVIEPTQSLPTVLSVAFPGDDSESMLLMNLDIYQISASGGSACTSGSVHPSHVLHALGHSPARMANTVRFSFGPQTTLQEIDYTLDKLAVIFGQQVQA